MKVKTYNNQVHKRSNKEFLHLQMIVFASTFLCNTHTHKHVDFWSLVLHINKNNDGTTHTTNYTLSICVSHVISSVNQFLNKDIFYNLYHEWHEQYFTEVTYISSAS